ncbi:hypothetical protein MSP8886_01427 [Marinomonas spartinae]|uniref:Uncharacterized protein n=1 Tax=Marinomonas spartinae TaxID=1792290 RepID=A0A1A8T8R2_9GAMM|nr:phage tail protein [Marinomonas spartinae]SBS29072.1 hypothetical protein MSP8886_01427 [Marinomonas spartinae]
MDDFRFSIKNDFDGIDRILNSLEKDLIPKATVRALNRTADKVQEHLVKIVLPKYIDRPTRWTLNAVMTRYARQKRMEAVILLKDRSYVSKGGGDAASYLNPMIEGGDRNAKNFERRLRRSGLIRKGQYAVPGADIRLDRFGNIPKSTSAHILRDVQAFTESGHSQNTMRKARKFFMLPKAPHKPIGIYYRQGKKLKQAIVFTDDAPNYERRLPFYKEADKKARDVISEEFSEAAKYYAVKVAK